MIILIIIIIIIIIITIIINSYNARTIKEYSKALYINLK